MILDQFFHPKTLRKHIRRSDFWKKENFCGDRENIDSVLEALCKRVYDQAYAIEHRHFVKDGKEVYLVNDFDNNIILRKISHDIKKIYKIQTRSRDSIINQVISLLKDGSSFSVVRTDIKSFFESIPIYKTLNKIERDGLISSKSVQLIKSLYKTENEKYNLRRGFCASSVLSEIYMRQIDNKIRLLDGIYYYNRFVDDIIIFSTSDPLALLSKIKEILGPELTINKDKTSITAFPCDTHQAKGYDSHKKCNINTCPNKAKEINYLGYRFTVPCLPTHKNTERSIQITLSKNKIKKIKTRIAKAFIQYASDKDTEILIKRIKFLTSNIKIPSNNRTGYIMTGLFFLYPVLTDPPKSLNELDTFLKKCINCSRNAFHGNGFIPDNDRMTLNKLSFTGGYINKICHKLSYKQLCQIGECWKHV